ncbi:MAG TPA: hypothetical protein VMH28_17280 [Candidatus Acidoferrales bacterium]|nr:hypothetical protein [Candidatus Acidoferrales bacterium]
MMQNVQLAIADQAYAARVRDALCHTCAWQVESVERPDASRNCVMVLDQCAFQRLPLPLSHPERVVLISRKNPELMAEAWDAGIVSVVSDQDPMNTVLLAILAAGLRVEKPHQAAGTATPHTSSAISPSGAIQAAPISPETRISGSKRCKIQ